MVEALVGATLRLLPISIAYAITQRIASRPRRASIAGAEARAVAGARATRLGQGGRLPALEWGDGPTVCLVHGWGGRAAQLAPLGQRLAEAGFRTVAFDVAGHGESDVPTAAWERFMGDIAAAVTELRPSAIIGHSAGALALMAARKVQGIDVPTYVCVCAPHHPYPPLRALRRRLNPRDGVLRRVQADLARQFGRSWHALEQGAAWEGAGDELLLCYDESDRYIEPADGDRIHALCPGSTLFKTSRFGHSRILAARELAEAIQLFLRRAQ